MYPHAKQVIASLYCRHHSLQGSADSRLAELQAEVQVARFEKERVSLVHQETLKDLRQLQLDQEKQQRKASQEREGGYQVLE